MLSTSGVLCNFPGMLQDFPDSVRLVIRKGEKGLEVWKGEGGEERGRGMWGVSEGSRETWRGGEKCEVFPYITTLAVCDKKLLQLRYTPDVWVKQSQLI